MVETKQKPVRIAQVIGQVVSGGVEAVVMNYYRNIDRTQVQFDFIIDGDEETYLDEEINALGGRVYHVKAYEKSMLKNMIECYRIFKSGNYQVVHSHLNTLSVFTLFAAWLAGVKTRIAHNHSTVAKGEGKRAILKYILRPWAKVFANHYCACSDYAGRWLFGKTSADMGRVKIFKNAIDAPNYSFKPDVRRRVREQLGLTDRFVVGHVGRFAYQKNHAFLIEIFREVYKKNPNAVLLLVGSGGLEQEIKDKARQWGLADAVLFLGVRRDVEDLLQAMDVFVFPSHFEGLGLVAIEAQASGLKTLVSREVPEEARVTNLLEYASLTAPAEDWAEKVLANTHYPREKIVEAIRRSGYDITQAASELGFWYAMIMKGKMNAKKVRLRPGINAAVKNWVNSNLWTKAS